MPSFVPAQVIIKEKVEINPVQPLQGENPIVIFPDSIYGGNGDRSFSNNPQYISDNPQSTIILPTGGTVTVRIISSEAAGDAKIDLLQNQPEQQTLTEYANHYLGFNWTSQFYPPGTNVEFGIYWYWNYYGTIYEGNEAGAIVTQLGANKYEIGFEAAGDDWDYNELVIQVTIEDFELLVDINPPEISTGETAVVTVKKQFYDGRVEDFPAGQLFEFGMMEGCVAGGLVSGTDTAAYFNGVTQPILFVAADSLENDEETVRIGVGLVEQIIARPINSINKTVQKGILSKTTDEVVYKEKEISDVIIIGGACSGVELNSTKQSFANVVVGGCKQKTVICNNYQPPKLENVSSISILGENKPWNWKDDKGKNQNTSTGDACNNQMTNGCNDITFGQTYIMPKIGYFASGTPPPPIYNRLDDMKIVVCLDKSDPNHQYWNFNIENLRVPIFTAHCPDEPANCYYVDLGDGSDATLLSQYIKNCTDYNKVMHVLKDYWVFGPARIGGLPYEKYYFSAGVIFHENHHVDQIEKYLYLILNSTGGLKQLANKRIEKNNQYKCPEDALNAKKQEIKELINDFLYIINDLKTLMNKNNTGKYISEIEADKVASLEYEKIKTRIQNWAIQQSWWCELRPIGIIGNPTFLDCGLIPCNP